MAQRAGVGLAGSAFRGNRAGWLGWHGPPRSRFVKKSSPVCPPASLHTTISLSLSLAPATALMSNTFESLVVTRLSYHRPNDTPAAADNVCIQLPDLSCLHPFPVEVFSAVTASHLLIPVVSGPNSFRVVESKCFLNVPIPSAGDLVVVSGCFIQSVISEVVSRVFIHRYINSFSRCSPLLQDDSLESIASVYTVGSA